MKFRNGMSGWLGDWVAWYVHYDTGIGVGMGICLHDLIRTVEGEGGEDKVGWMDGRMGGRLEFNHVRILVDIDIDTLEEYVVLAYLPA
jgi:hypothetical protein